MAEIGDQVLVTYTPLSTAGAPATVTTGVLTVTQPDGTTLVPTTSSLSGTWRATFVATQGGRHAYRWVFTGVDAQAYSDMVYVSENTGVVQVEEVIAFLRSQTSISSNVDKEQLQEFIRAATSICESYIRGPIALAEFTEVADGSSEYIVLKRQPITSISSITENGNTLTGSDYVLDRDAGIIYRGTTTGALPFGYGRLNCVVTYTAGYKKLPSDLKMAILREIEHLWGRTQTSPHPAMGADATFDEMVRDSAASSSIPGAIRYLLAPYMVSGFA